MATGIQQTIEVIDALETILVELGAAARDGRLGAGEILGIVGASLGKLQTALEGAEAIPAELGELALDELDAMLARFQQAVFAVLRSFRGEAAA